MHKMTITYRFIRSLVVAALAIVGASSKAFAQGPWVDTVPQQALACISGDGKLEDADIGTLFHNHAKAAGATELGFSFVTKTGKSSDPSASTTWQACAPFKGVARASEQFQIQSVAASSGAFLICEGTEAKVCAETLLTWIKAKVPDFDTPTRLIPLFDFTPDKTQTIRSGLSRIVLQTFPLEADDAPSQVPDPSDDLERQLYGKAMQPRTARPLLTEKPDPRLIAAKQGGSRTYSGILVYVPLTETQRNKIGLQ